MPSQAIPAIGHAAPPFALPEATGLSCSSPRGVPWVLVFARAWKPDEAAEDVALHALLRGLGAVMVVVADAGVWWFHPDDDDARCAPPGARLAAEVAAIAGRYGVAPGTDAAFIIDASGVLRAVHLPAERLATSLPGALAASSSAMLQARRQGRDVSRRELTVRSLVTGFGVVLAPAGRTRRPTEPPAPPPPPADGLDVVLDVEGRRWPLTIDPRTSLHQVLRDHLGVADEGRTVRVDGRAIDASLMLAVMAEGAAITLVAAGAGEAGEGEGAGAGAGEPWQREARRAS